MTSTDIAAMRRGSSRVSRRRDNVQGHSKTIDTQIRHVTKRDANLFEELGFSSAEAKKLHAATGKQVDDTEDSGSS